MFSRCALILSFLAVILLTCSLVVVVLTLLTPVTSQDTTPMVMVLAGINWIMHEDDQNVTMITINALS